MRSALVLLALAVIGTAACSGSGGANSVVEDVPASADDLSTDAGDPDSGSSDADIEFLDFELRWADDGEPVGSVIDYGSPIAVDRLDAGIVAVATFRITGDPGDVEVDLLRPVTVNGELMEGNTLASGPERGISKMFSDVETTVTSGDSGDDRLVVHWDVGRPLSPVTVVDARANFEEMFGIDADVEEVMIEDLSDFGLAIAADLVDLPPAPVGGANDYEYGITGTIRLASGFALDVDAQIDVRTIEAVPPPTEETDCLEAVRVVADRLESPAVPSDDAGVETVVISDLRIVDRLAVDGELLGCEPGFVAMSLCAVAQSVSASGAGTPLLEQAAGACPLPDEATRLTSIVPIAQDGVLRTLIPQGSDGQPALRVALSVPADETWTSDGARSGDERPSARYVHPTYGVGVTVRVSSEPVASPAASRLAEAVAPLVDTDLVVVDEEVTVAGRPGRMSIVDPELGFGAAEVVTAVAVDDDRLFVIGLRIVDRDVDTTIDVVRRYVECLQSSVVIAPFALEAPPDPAVDCSTLDPTTDEVQSEVAAATPESPTTVRVQDGTPTFDGRSVTIPLGTGAFTDAPPATVTFVAPEWPLDEILDGQASPGVALEAPVAGSSFRATVDFTGDGPLDYGASVEKYLEPTSNSEVLLDDREVPVAGRVGRVKVARYRSISDDTVTTGKIVVPVDAGRTLYIRMSLASEDPLDMTAEIERILSSISIEP